MAEVALHWPQPRQMDPPAFIYPWEQWASLDENGHGDIWLAQRGVDWPDNMPPVRFRSVLYNRATRETKKRERDAPLVVKRVTVRSRRTGEIREKVKRVPDFRPLRVKVVIASDEVIAFQFYDSPEPPPEPPMPAIVPKRRQPLHRAVNRRTIERVPVGV